jgi:hypothetical protein
MWNNRGSGDTAGSERARGSCEPVGTTYLWVSARRCLPVSVGAIWAFVFLE